jgi:hypothetical protein
LHLFLISLGRHENISLLKWSFSCLESNQKCDYFGIIYNQGPTPLI